MLRIMLPSEKQVLPTSLSCRVVIVGGGFTGASVARLLAISGNYKKHEIVVLEPREKLGTGLAYDTQDPALRLNVAASRMRAIPGDPQAFLRWLENSGRLMEDPEALCGGNAIYARRADFGSFMEEQMEPLIESDQLLHLNERAESLVHKDGGWQVRGDHGSVIQADVVVIATTHPKPRSPGMIASALDKHPQFIPDASLNGTLENVGQDDRVFIVGAGLTALDIVASLRNRQHTGEIILFSRSGLLPQPQPEAATSAFGDFLSPPSCRVSLLLKQIRKTIRQAIEAGLPWQSVFDALRQQGQAIWQALPAHEQKRFQRHLRRVFETHRYRMPPQIVKILKDSLETKQLTLRAGKISRVENDGEKIVIDLITKKDGLAERQACDWVIAATGPDHGSVIGFNPYLEELESAGLVRSDSHGTGIACDDQSHAIDSKGQSIENLFIAGPLARGTFGELTGVPEIAAQAEQIAKHIIRLTTASQPLQNNV